MNEELNDEKQPNLISFSVAVNGNTMCEAITDADMLRRDNMTKDEKKVNHTLNRMSKAIEDRNILAVTFTILTKDGNDLPEVEEE